VSRYSTVSLGNSKEAQSVSQLANDIIAQFERLGLNTSKGQRLLAETMATHVIQEFLPDGVSEDEIAELPFHAHLTSYCNNLIKYEDMFDLPDALFAQGKETHATGWFSKDRLPTSELWELEESLKLKKNMLDDFDTHFRHLAMMVLMQIEPLVQSCPSLLTPASDESSLSFSVPLEMMINDLADVVERMIQLPFAPEFDDTGLLHKLRKRLEYNLVTASGGIGGDPSSYPKQVKLPTKQTASSDQLIKTYMTGTPLPALFDYTVPITIPNETRFEHHFIVAGSGHGKTQTLQSLILHDLQNVSKGDASIVVLDSQGDLINNIRNLEIFAEGNPLADRLVVIDPTDVEYPVSLNLFDVNMERINSYSQLDRERMVNGILELYDFILGSLIGAEMTQKQSVLFRYITRLLLYIPNATIHTFRELLEDGGSLKYQDSIDQLQGSAKAFFQSEFDSKEFAQTKRQVVRRLWGILENQTFERMFSHPENKLDLYTEMNSGKVILINTAKDLLKETGTEIFGRFFIAMIAQAAQERSVISKDKRMPTYVYVDEASDYYDHNIGIILSQARKFKVGMLTATQFLSQMDNKLQDAVFANTSIKFAGGVSAKDASILAREMRTDTATIERQEKLSFAAFIKDTTKQAISIAVKAGLMERLPKMGTDDFTNQRDVMRERYATHYSEMYNQDNETNVKSGDVVANTEATPWE